MTPREWTVLPLILLALSCTHPAASERGGAPQAARPLRLLVLSGGGYHDFAGNLAILLPAVAARLPLAWTQVVLKPADKATPAERAVLDAVDLSARFDVILDYTQGDLALSDVARD